MLVCDLCDKGFHMACLEPPLDEKPNGTCSLRSSSASVSLMSKADGRGAKDANAKSSRTLSQPACSTSSSRSLYSTNSAKSGKWICSECIETGAAALTNRVKRSSGSRTRRRSSQSAARFASHSATALTDARSTDSPSLSCSSPREQENIPQFQWVAEMKSLIPTDLGPVHKWSVDDVEKVNISHPTSITTSEFS